MATTTNTEEEKKFTTGYQSQYRDQIQGLYDQIANRKDFTYDVNADAMYQQLKDQYIQGGRMAMMDTMGQAQAMTGGYGNSYAQGVGQQAYQGYLQGLNDQVPNLYQMALNRYIQQGDQMLDQYSMLTSQEAQDYARWQDQQNLALQQAQAMMDKGVRPSDELLAQTGLSKEYLDAMLPENAGGGGGYDMAAEWRKWLEKQNGGDGGDGGDVPDDYATVAYWAMKAKNRGDNKSEVASFLNESTLSIREKNDILSNLFNNDDTYATK